MTETTKEKSAKYECRFAVFCPNPEGRAEDLHFVKEVVHHPDGRIEPNTRIIRNYKRPFWITQKGMQNHQDKKEWEEMSRLNKYNCTQSELIPAIAKALGTPWFKGDQKRLQRSPYVYGSDILSTALIKKSYQDRWPDVITTYSVACFDTETDVIHGTGEILMGTVSKKEKVFTAINKIHVEGLVDVEARLQELLIKYLGEYVEKRKIKWEIKIVDNEAEVVKACIEKAHEWKPDFLAIWNMDFDLTKSVYALEKHGVDPKDVFSDPSVPQEFKFFKYKRGSTQKKTASGKIMPKKPSDQWHTVYTPASFYIIDAMCAYKQIRTGQAEEPSYSLDALLEKNLGVRKLNFEEAEGFVRLEWHQFMQEKHPLEYVIYNVFDTVGMEELDEKTKDLQLQMPMLAEASDFCHFNSQPRRLVDALHFDALKKQKVMGSTSDEMTDDFDAETIGLEDWIITLPAHLVQDNGLCVIEEDPWLRTNIRAHVGD